MSHHDLDTAFDGTPGRCWSGRSPQAGMERATCSRSTGHLRTQGRPSPPTPRPTCGFCGRQSVQHQLPHRRSTPRVPRPLVRHDPARREPGQGPAGQKAGPVASFPTCHLAITPPPSSPTTPTPHRRRRRSKPSTTSSAPGHFLTTCRSAVRPSSSPGLSSAASAASAAVDSCQHPEPTPDGDFTSLPWCPTASTEFPRATVRFPVRAMALAVGRGRGLTHDPFASDRIRITTRSWRPSGLTWSTCCVAPRLFSGRHPPAVVATPDR